MFSWYPKDRGCQRIECPHYITSIVNGINIKNLSYTNSPDLVQCELPKCIYDREPTELLPKHNPDLLTILTQDNVERLLI